jgi:hypothetical protein
MRRYLPTFATVEAMSQAAKALLETPFETPVKCRDA